MLKTLSQKTFVTLTETTHKICSYVRNFLVEETSAKGTAEEGTNMYMVLVIAVVIGAIVYAAASGIFTDIMGVFRDGTTKKPVGW